MLEAHYYCFLFLFIYSFVRSNIVGRYIPVLRWWIPSWLWWYVPAWYPCQWPGWVGIQQQRGYVLEGQTPAWNEKMKIIHILYEFFQGLSHFYHTKFNVPFFFFFCRPHFCHEWSILHSYLQQMINTKFWSIQNFDQAQYCCTMTKGSNSWKLHFS